MHFLIRRTLSRSSLSPSKPSNCILLIKTLASLPQASVHPSPKPGEPSYSTAFYVLNSPKVAKESGAASSSWRKPSVIPFQGKAANSVKLIGCVQLPVQFQTLPDGKPVAATVIKQDNHELSTAMSLSVPYLPSVLIPVVFEGDLAHVVKCHVKETACVFVSGKLCGDPLPFAVGDHEGSFHIVAQDVYFVQGRVEGKAPGRGNGAVISDSNTAPDDVKAKELKNGEVDCGSRTAHEVFMRKDVEKGAAVSEDWWDLINNPNEWLDYRRRKSEGTVKSKHPDFKHAAKGTALWLSNETPEEVVKALQGLNFSSGQFKNVKEELWKRLVENPEKWWDNRSSKWNEKAPDFKNKESGEGLWLSSAPEWVESKLPPPPNKPNVARSSTPQVS
ncbi:unnamed protein product [Cuscuta campestris]|uniref:Uncharacterized protein n=1 Tax=Cuscuta campestris TaxID=132261 RepID=A0A484N6R2_9ASTE|nr:unnamed protein product [Cuscuta campestris]